MKQSCTNCLITSSVGSRAFWILLAYWILCFIWSLISFSSVFFCSIKSRCANISSCCWWSSSFCTIISSCFCCSSEVRSFTFFSSISFCSRMMRSFSLAACSDSACAFSLSRRMVFTRSANAKESNTTCTMVPIRALLRKIGILGTTPSAMSATIARPKRKTVQAITKYWAARLPAIHTIIPALRSSTEVSKTE